MKIAPAAPRTFAAIFPDPPGPAMFRVLFPGLFEYGTSGDEGRIVTVQRTARRWDGSVMGLKEKAGEEETRNKSRRGARGDIPACGSKDLKHADHAGDALKEDNENASGAAGTGAKILQSKDRKVVIVRVLWEKGGCTNSWEEIRKYDEQQQCELLFRYARFAEAYLAAKRCRKKGTSFEVNVPVVYNSKLIPVDFGRPSQWKPGVASRVLSNELKVATIFFDPGDDWADEGYQVDDALTQDTRHIWIGCEEETDAGGLSYQEDRSIKVQIMNNNPDYPELMNITMPDLSFFAVFDGHGGEGTAEFVQHHLPRSFAKELRKCLNKKLRGSFNTCLVTALKKAFKITDNLIKEMIDSRAWGEQSIQGTKTCMESSGAAAVAAVLCGRELVVAHVGDCRAVMSDKQGKSKLLTKDHTYYNIEERERVEFLGGNWEHSRLNSMLGVSRAFGDYCFQTNRKFVGLSAEPEIFQTTITDEHELLLLASDGFWSEENGQGYGFRDSAEAVTCLRTHLQKNNNDLKDALRLAISRAVKCSESDNTTGILISFCLLQQESYRPISFPKERPKFFCKPSRSTES
eukprot:768003-Hanusia_phi.AAC.5